jgi:hypothetical protein
MRLRVVSNDAPILPDNQSAKQLERAVLGKNASDDHPLVLIHRGAF